MLAAGLGGLGTEIVINFRTRAARTRVAHLPEVVGLVETEDAVFGEARDLLPEGAPLGFVVLAENGDVELVLRGGRNPL